MTHNSTTRVTRAAQRAAERAERTPEQQFAVLVGRLGDVRARRCREGGRLLDAIYGPATPANG